MFPAERFLFLYDGSWFSSVWFLSAKLHTLLHIVFWLHYHLIPLVHLFRNMKHNITLYVLPIVSQYMSALLQSFQNKTAFVYLSSWLVTCYYWLYLQKTEYAMHKGQTESPP
jgi:hypothetical protein